MKPYNQIPIWHTKRRLSELEEFHGNVQEYFANSRAEWMVDGRIEEAAGIAAKKKVNLTLQKARRLIAMARVSTTITYTPPPAVGGYVQNVDVIQNIFSIGQFRISPDMPISMIEQAIGVYQDDIGASWLRTLNPLWWIGNVLSWFAVLPFTALRTAGFDSARAQQSFGGKVVSLIFVLIPVVASAVTILEAFGLLEPVKNVFWGGA